VDTLSEAKNYHEIRGFSGELNVQLIFESIPHS
jgi:hypothetical protein